MNEKRSRVLIGFMKGVFLASPEVASINAFVVSGGGEDRLQATNN